ncbi:TetR family transcriptional regulator [Promicromonospora sp. NPDC050262]
MQRRRVCEVSEDDLGAGGLDVPLREIARRAEVGAATVYRHFATKGLA